MLVCDGVSLERIARDYGTPLYVYSATAIRTSYRELDEAFAPYPHRIHYAMKANSSYALVRLLREAGSGVDANSIGEVELAMRAGFAPADIVFSGVGKSPDEIDRAVQLGLKAINAESPGELERIDRAAQARGVRANVALRVNPDIDAGTHPHISTGLHINKFGVPIEHARELYLRMSAQPGLNPVGIHVHLGSQIISTEPIQRAAHAVVRLARDLRGAGIPLEHLDIGGGLGISYDGSRAPTAAEYAAAVIPIVSPSGLSVALEPGRYIVGAAAALLARVVDLKDAPGGHHFAVLDAGMTELMRPMLYGAFHRIVAVTPRAARDVSLRHRRTRVREYRHVRERSPPESARSRGCAGDPGCRRLRIRDVFELQPPVAAGGGHRRRLGGQADTKAPDHRRSAGAGNSEQ